MQQDGQVVFRHAVSRMAEVSLSIMHRTIWPPRMSTGWYPIRPIYGLLMPRFNGRGYREKVMINIEKYGNQRRHHTCLPVGMGAKLRKGDNIILTAFGAGFVVASTSSGGMMVKTR